MYVDTTSVPEFFRLVALVVGSLMLWKTFFMQWLGFIYNISNSTNLVNKLGHWCVITGATDGIGKAMAFEFAKRGMNIFLIARDADKLKGVSKEIKEEVKTFCGSIKTLTVDFDSSVSNNSSSCDGLNNNNNNNIYDLIEKELTGLNIGVLVNNVGLSYPHAMYYNELPRIEIDRLIDVNLRSALYLTHIVYEGMMNRRKGAIICVGSGASALPSEPLYAAYVAVKAGIEGFCKSLQVECASHNILVQCHVPLLVTTKLSKCKTPSITTPSTKRYAACAIRSIERGSISRFGGVTSVSPYRIHAMILFIANKLPAIVWNSFRWGQVKALRDRALKKKMAAKEGKSE